MKKYFIFIVCSIVISLVTPLQAAYVGIKGIILNNSPENVKIQLLNPFNQAQPLLEEVAVGKKGNYSFSFNATEIGFFYLQYADNQRVLVVLEPNKTIEIDFDYNTGEVKRVVNSAENELLQQFQQINKDANEQMEKIKQKGASASIEEMASINAKLMVAKQQLCMQNKSNYTTSLLIDYLPMETNKVIYDTVLNVLYQKYPENTYIKSKYDAYQSAKKVSVGNPAPELVLPDTNGKIFSLSSLKGKVVLIDFWASWCGPCRRENPNMVKLYNTYHQHGLEILGVSLDKTHNQWLDAIHNDGLTWNHISDLKYWSSVAPKIYNFNSVPHTVLVDKNGIIVAIGLRGAELEQKVKETLNLQ